MVDKWLKLLEKTKRYLGNVLVLDAVLVSVITRMMFILNTTKTMMEVETPIIGSIVLLVKNKYQLVIGNNKNKLLKG
jgi:hypothetical protein